MPAANPLAPELKRPEETTFSLSELKDLLSPPQK
jgi:hypothetical protein